MTKQNSDELTRYKIASNPSTPTYVLERLADDPIFMDETSWRVRAAMAENPNASPKILHKLLDMGETRIANNPNLSLELTERLINLSYYDLQRPAPSSRNFDGTGFLASWRYGAMPSGNIRMLKQIINDVRTSLAKHPNTPAEMLEKLSRDVSTDVRWSLAGNPNTPVNILKRLSKSKNYEIRLNIINNPNTPRDVLERLTSDDDETVSRDAKRRLFGCDTPPC